MESEFDEKEYVETVDIQSASCTIDPTNPIFNHLFQPSASTMDRREAIKRIGALTGLAVSSSTIAGIMAGCQADSGYLRVLSPQQFAQLDVMTEHILPATDTPGARDAEVAGFIDAMLADFYPGDQKNEFLQALVDTDQRAQRQFGQAFLDCTPEDQFALLDVLDAEAFPDQNTMTEEERAAFAAAPRRFMATLKELTLAGFYTSEVGATVELRVNPMGAFYNDIPYSEVGRAWA